MRRLLLLAAIGATLTGCAGPAGPDYPAGSAMRDARACLDSAIATHTSAHACLSAVRARLAARTAGEGPAR